MIDPKSPLVSAPKLSSTGFSLTTDTLEHWSLSETMDAIEDVVFGADDFAVIQVVGCTGVGKSHLMQAVIKKIRAKYQEEMERDRAFIPVAGFTVRLLTNRAFSWTGFYEDYLTALEHPEPRSRDANEARRKIAMIHKTRRPMVVFVDEAHHILEGNRDPKAVHTQSEVIKSLTQDSGSKLVLVGTYDLLPLVRLNGQTSRRNRVIHFKRYADTLEDHGRFKEVLQHLDHKCAAILDLCLADKEAYIYEKTLGLVGLLRTWLVQALANNERFDGKSLITESALAESELSAADLLPIMREAASGEQSLSATTEQAKELSRLLQGERPNPDTPAPNDQVNAEGSPKKKRRRPGSRPRRTPTGEIGGIEHAA